MENALGNIDRGDPLRIYLGGADRLNLMAWREFLAPHFRVVGLGTEPRSIAQEIEVAAPRAVLLSADLGRATLVPLVETLVRLDTQRLGIVVFRWDPASDLALSLIRAGAHGVVPVGSDLDALLFTLNEAADGMPVVPAEIGKSAARRNRDGRGAGGWKPGLPLTPREREVMLLVTTGRRNHEIAAALGISEYTVRNHLHHAFQKMGARNRIEAVRLLRLQNERRETTERV